MIKVALCFIFIEIFARPMVLGEVFWFQKWNRGELPDAMTLWGCGVGF
jgi:hypothetical protein